MRAGLLIAVLLLTACVGASPSSPAPVSEPVRQLADKVSLAFAFEDPLTVSAMTNQTDYDALWTRLMRAGLAGPPPVDFERELVVYLGMAGSSSCPEEFQRLVVDLDAQRVYGEWQTKGGGACTDDLQSQGVLLAVSRAVLPTGPFVLSLRERALCADCTDHPDQTLVDPTAR